MNNFKIKSIRLEFDSFQGLKDGIVLPSSRIGAAGIIRATFQSNIPVLVVDKNDEVLFRLIEHKGDQIKAISQNKY